MAGKFWTPSEEKKLVSAVKKAQTVEEAIPLIQKALPDREVTLAAIDKKFQRMNLPSTFEQVQSNRNARTKDAHGVELARFVTVAKNGATVEELCDKFELPPKKVKALIEEARNGGYRIAVNGDKVGYVPPSPRKDEQKIIAQPGSEEVFAVISDLHVGSRYCLEDQLRDFIIRAAKEDGVTQFFLGGDNVDGCYKHSRWEESHHGFDAQAERLAHVLPGKVDGLRLRYDGIIGNHDETFEKESGLDVGRALVDVFRREGRDDFHMHGARGAYLRYAPKGGRGVLVELWHPLGGGAYAVSYKLQRHVEEYGVGQKPDFLFAGHWHQQCYVVRRGVHAFSAGTWHGGAGAFSKALGGAQAIGGWVVKYKQTREGALRDVTPTWRAYYEAETIRDVGLT